MIENIHEKSRVHPVHISTGRVVGQVIDGTLVKTVDSRRHQLKKPPAWACDISVLKQAENLGATKIILQDIHSEINWNANLSAFWGKGSFRLNRGYGEQRCLPLPLWTKSGKNIPEQLSFTGLLN
jgi:hypothetical protein